MLLLVHSVLCALNPAVSVQSLLLFVASACTVFLLLSGEPKFIVTEKKIIGLVLYFAAHKQLNGLWVSFSWRSMSSTKRKFCEHCQDFVSTRTYRQHLDLYYNKESGQWNIRQIQEESSDEERSDPADVDVCAEEVNQLHDVCIQRPVAMASCDGGSVSEPGLSLYV